MIKKQQKINSITVIDNGVGFTDENFDSFLTCYSSYKQNNGGKGIGRFTCLKVFDYEEVHSVYLKDGRIFKRSFIFEPRNELKDEQNFEVNEDKQTAVILRNMGGFDGDKIKTDLENARKKLIPITEKLKEAVNKQFAITCFSKNPNSILMWSHYGNKHTGFCVEYNFEKCRNWDALINLLPVLYSVERSSLPMGLFDFSNPQEVKLNNISDHIPELTMLLLSKSNEWDYEEEWRIINAQSQLIDGHLLDLHTISHIYLGANISKENEELIKDIAKKQCISISKYRISPEQYKLEVES